MKKILFYILAALVVCACSDGRLDTMKAGAERLLAQKAEKQGNEIVVLNIEPVKTEAINEDSVDRARIKNFRRLAEKYFDEYLFHADDYEAAMRLWVEQHPSERSEARLNEAFDSIQREFDKVKKAADYYRDLIPVIENRIAIRREPKKAYRFTADVNANRKDSRTGKLIEAIADRMTFYFDESLAPIDIDEP